jgi:hypothetical protein
MSNKMKRAHYRCIATVVLEISVPDGKTDKQLDDIKYALMNHLSLPEMSLLAAQLLKASERTDANAKRKISYYTWLIKIMSQVKIESHLALNCEDIVLEEVEGEDGDE